MKRFMAIVMILIMALSLAACGGGGVSQEEYDRVVAERDALQAQLDAMIEQPTEGDASVAPTDNTEPLQKDGFDEDAVIQQLNTKVYQYVNSIKKAEIFLVVENTSQYNLDLSVNVTGRDAEGGMVGAKQKEINAVSAGATVVFSIYMDEVPSEISYEFSAKQEEWFDSVIQNITYTSESAKNKEIVSVTNEGDKAIEFVEGTILFFSNGELVGADSTYFTDDDTELKPGKTIIKEMKAWEPYDSYEIYFTGHAD